MSYGSLLFYKTQMDGKYCVSKIIQSFFTIKGGSTPFSSSEGENITALRYSEQLSSKDEKTSCLCQIVQDGTSGGR